MKYRVIIHGDALRAVEDFLDYISEVEQQPQSAIRWWQKALKKVDSLEFMPHRCPFAPENVYSENELRMLIIDRCLFIFHIDEQARSVQVVKFRHGSQLP